MICYVLLHFKWACVLHGNGQTSCFMFGTLFWNLAIKHEFRKGVQFVNDWMSQHCRLCTIGDDKGRSALSDFTRFLVDTQAAGQTCFGLISQTFFAVFQIRPTPDSVELINMYMSTQEEHYHQAPRGVCVCAEIT